MIDPKGECHDRCIVTAGSAGYVCRQVADRFSGWGVVLVLAPVRAQVLTSEDSLTAALRPDDRKTCLSGYGELKVSYDLALGSGSAP